MAISSLTLKAVTYLKCNYLRLLSMTPTAWLQHGQRIHLHSQLLGFWDGPDRVITTINSNECLAGLCREELKFAFAWYN